jgi:hypothetical protein
MRGLIIALAPPQGIFEQGNFADKMSAQVQPGKATTVKKMGLTGFDSRIS